MSHVGISVLDRRNASVCRELARRLTPDEFTLAVRRLELLLARSPNPELAARIAHLKDRGFEDLILPESEEPCSVSVWNLSTRPDIVDALWEIGRQLPLDSCWVAYRRAVLAHPSTGVIFGLAIGSFGYALRITQGIKTEWPAEIRFRGFDGEETFSLAKYGLDWRFVSPDGTAFEIARAAYDCFGEPIP